MHHFQRKNAFKPKIYGLCNIWHHIGCERTINYIDNSHILRVHKLSRSFM